MSDFDFLKEFGKNMGRDRLHEPSESGWSGLAASLDARDAAEKRRRRAVGWIFPVAVAASFLWLATSFWRAEQRADGLRTEVLMLKSSLEKVKFTSDTVVRRVEIVRFDTVYRTVVVRRVVEEFRTKPAFFEPVSPIGGKNEAVAEGFYFENKKGEASGTAAEISTKNRPKTTIEQSVGIAQKNEDSAVFNGNSPEIAPEKADLSDFSNKEDNSQSCEFYVLRMGTAPTKLPKPVFSITKRQLPETGLTMLAAPPAGQKERVVRRLRSPDFEIGARSALLFPVTDRASGNSFSLGMTVEKAVSNRLNLIAGVDFGQLYFHVDPDNLPDSGLPVPAPPTPSDVLKKTSVGQPILDFSVGFQCNFMINKRFRPYFSTAWVGEQANRQQLRYEYFDPITEGRSQVRIAGLSQNFNARGAQMVLGGEYRLRRWTVGASGFYQKHFDSRDAFLAERFGLRASGRYSF